MSRPEDWIEYDEGLAEHSFSYLQVCELIKSKVHVNINELYCRNLQTDEGYKCVQLHITPAIISRALRVYEQHGELQMRSFYMAMQVKCQQADFNSDAPGHLV